MKIPTSNMSPFDRLWLAFILAVSYGIGTMVAFIVLASDFEKLKAENVKQLQVIKDQSDENHQLRIELQWWRCERQPEQPPAPVQVGPTLLEDIPQLELDEAVPPVGVVGAARSGKWPSVRAEYFAAHPHCEFKGCKSKGPFQVHHVKSFSRNPELELDLTNLITLCAGESNHHLYVGHQGNFQDINPHVREDCKRGVIPAIGMQRMAKHRGPSKTVVAP